MPIRFHSEDGNPIEAKAEAVALVLHLSELGVRAWNAHSGPETIGYAVVGPMSGEGAVEIEELWVSARHRPAASAAVLSLVCRELAMLGADCAWIAIAPDAAAARSISRNNGFTTTALGTLARRLR